MQMRIHIIKMYLMKKIVLLTLVFGALMFAFIAKASNIVECFDCDASKESTAVSNWAWQYIPNASLTSPGSVISKTVTVIDLAQREASTYEVKKARLPGSPMQPAVYSVALSKVQTEATIQMQMSEIVAADNEMKAAAKALVVPNSVVSNAWEFVNCAYCQTRIRDFLNNSIPGQIETLVQVVNHFAQTLGLVQTSLPNIFKMNLESGGNVTFKLTLTNSPVELEIELMSVTDEGGNVVPFNAANLKGLNLYITNPAQANIINTFIMHYSMYIPVRTGRVTITDCLRPDLPTCKVTN